MTSESDNRPYISGWDECEHFNICKQWFKWDGLLNIWLKKKDYPTGVFGSPDEDKMSDEDKIRLETAHEVIGCIEDHVREVLWEKAEELEASRKEFDHYINGLQDALKCIGKKKITSRYSEDG